MSDPEVDSVVARLRELAHLLTATGQDRWAATLGTLAEQVEAAAGSPAERRTALGRVARLYAGAGSFSDLVLQDAGGVRPEQGRLDKLRSALHDAVAAAYGSPDVSPGRSAP